MLKDIAKKHSNDSKNLINEAKRLEKECKSIFEKMEKTKSSYISQSKECDNLGIEKESLFLNKEIPVDKKLRVH